jgi:hypothetical protein
MSIWKDAFSGEVPLIHQVSPELLEVPRTQTDFIAITTPRICRGLPNNRYRKVRQLLEIDFCSDIHLKCGE